MILARKKNKPTAIISRLNVSFRWCGRLTWMHIQMTQWEWRIWKDSSLPSIIVGRDGAHRSLEICCCLKLDVVCKRMNLETIEPVKMPIINVTLCFSSQPCCPISQEIWSQNLIIPKTTMAKILLSRKAANYKFYHTSLKNYLELETLWISL